MRLHTTTTIPVLYLNNGHAVVLLCCCAALQPEEESRAVLLAGLSIMHACGTCRAAKPTRTPHQHCRQLHALLGAKGRLHLRLAADLISRFVIRASVLGGSALPLVVSSSSPLPRTSPRLPRYGLCGTVLAPSTGCPHMHETIYHISRTRAAN